MLRIAPPVATFHRPLRGEDAQRNKCPRAPHSSNLHCHRHPPSPLPHRKFKPFPSVTIRKPARPTYQVKLVGVQVLTFINYSIIHPHVHHAAEDHVATRRDARVGSDHLHDLTLITNGRLRQPRRRNDAARSGRKVRKIKL